MSTGALSARPALARSRVLRVAALLEREAPLVAAVALYAALIAALMPQMLVQDSWLTLAMGREIFQHGLPHTNTITVWAQGGHWTDQQWLAQVAFYGLDRVGGIRLVMLVHALVLSAAFAVALAAARARGASHKSILLVATVCSLIAPWGLQMRAQSLAPLLFVALLWLLVADGRAPSRRVLWVLPILVLWANIHGTVVLAALLVVIRALTRLTDRSADRRTRESLALLLSPVLVLVSPYGLSLIAYYRQMLASSELRTYIQEWHVSAPGARTAAFYLAAFAATALVARRARNVNRFEFLALAVLLISALSAIRSILWFGLACMVILPLLVDHELPTRAWRVPVSARVLAGLGVALIVVVAALAASRPASWFERAWPSGGVATISHALATSNVRVIADDRHSDWLLWKLPQLRGRIANDVRFELYSSHRLSQLAAFDSRSGTDWRAAGRGYGIVVLDAQDVTRRQARLYGPALYAGTDVIVVRNAHP